MANDPHNSASLGLSEDSVTGEIKNNKSINGAPSVNTAIREWELIDVGAGDYVITVGGGIAHAIMCDSDGTVLTVDTLAETNKATPVLRTGGNPYAITKVYQTGTTLVGNVYAVAW